MSRSLWFLVALFGILWISDARADDSLEEWTRASLEMLSPYRAPLDLLLAEKLEMESKADHDARYRSIARDVVSVVRAAKPLPGLSRENSLRLVLSIAFFESGFHRSVDLGLKKGRGDNGRSWCLMQLQLGSGTVPVDDPEMSSWRGKDLVEDRQKCFRAGMEILRRSMAACSALPPKSRLSAYASGKCSEEETEGRKRWFFAWQKVLGRKIL